MQEHDHLYSAEGARYFCLPKTYLLPNCLFVYLVTEELFLLLCLFILRVILLVVDIRLETAN